MGLGHRREETSCFCNAGCPAGTFPFRQYWVTTPALPGPNYNDNSYLFRWVSGSGVNCIWNPVTDHFIGPSLELLQFALLIDGPTIRGYQVALQLVDGTGLNIWRGSFFTSLPEPEGMVEPNSPSSCSRMVITMEHFIFGPASVAFIRPAYPDACDDADYPAKLQTKFLASF